MEFASAALRNPLMVFLCLLAVVLGAYLPTLDAQFIWDDNGLVRDNLLIRSPLFVVEAFRRNLFEGQSNFYRPTQTLTFIADYWFWGKQAYGYHLTNILIHALNGCLLYLLLRRLLPALLDGTAPGGEGRSRDLTDPIAALLAFVWALYPVHSAAVAYVSGSADSLAMLFCVTAWLLSENCLRAQTALRRAAWGAVTAISLLAGLCSKEIAFVWLALFTAYLLFFRRRDGIRFQRKAMLTAGGLLLVGAYVLLRHIPTPPPIAPPPQEFSRVLMSLRALGDYGSLLLFPGKLLMERQVFPAPNVALTFEDRVFYESLTAGGVLLLVFFGIGVACRGSGQRLRIFGVCWFLAGFLPVSNLFVTINASVAEHWLYLPSIGFLLFVTGCAWQLPTKKLRVAAVTLAISAAVAFGARTYQRSFDWMDELTFFRRTVEAGGDVPRARLGVANAYSHQRQDASAIILLRQVAAEYPNNLTAQINLANALARQGRVEEARPILERAFLQAGNSEPHVLMVILGSLDALEADRTGWPELREAAFTKARHHFPDYWELTQRDILIAAQSGRKSDALREAARYAGTHWWHYPSWYLLGCLYSGEGRLEEALAAFKQAGRLDVHDAEAFAAAAAACEDAGRSAAAAGFQQAAVERQPDSPRQRVLLARMLAAANRPSEAAAQLAIGNKLLSTGSVNTP